MDPQLQTHSRTEKEQESQSSADFEKQEAHKHHKNLKSEISNIQENLQSKSNIKSIETQLKELMNQHIDKLILADHSLIKTIYEKYKNSSNKDNAKWRNQLIYEIARHTISEELILYPLFRYSIPDGEKWYQDSIKEHQNVKKHLYDSQNIDPSDLSFKTKIDEITSILFKHFDDEENEILPLVRKHLDQEKLSSAGNQFARRKFILPTKPLTTIPEDNASLEELLNFLIAPTDKFRELFTSYPDQDKVNELIKQAIDLAQSSNDSQSLSNKENLKL